MVEPFAKQAGERTFTVRINHVPVLSNYDLFADTGDRWRATVKEFAATASQEGEVAILLDGGTGGKCAAVCAIEVLGRETERSVEAPAVARAFTRDLEPLPDRVVFAPHRDPVGMAFGPDGRLYVADNGPDLNVRATTSKALPSPGAPSA
jgi:glucose/arabinose dehydrogenase